MDYRAAKNFDDGLREVVDWYWDNEAWWRVILDDSCRDSSGRQPLNFSAARLASCDSGRRFKNIFRMFTGSAAYYGCAMALRRPIIDLVLPMPGYIESHDLWIALASNLIGSNKHLEENTVVRRVHGRNASIIRRSLYRKLRARVIFALSIIVITRRARGFRRQFASVADDTVATIRPPSRRP